MSEVTPTENAASTSPNHSGTGQTKVNQAATGRDPEDGHAALLTSNTLSPARDRHSLFVVMMGVLLFVTSVTQFSLGATLKSYGIQVLEVNFMESYYPPAGNPMPGFLYYGVGASFVMMSLFAEKGRRACLATIAIIVWSGLSLPIVLYGTLDQLTVYNFVKEFITCSQNFDDDDRFASDCVCSSRSTSRDSYDVNKARFEDFRCEDITDSTGGVLASYILTWFVVGLLVVNIFLHSRLWLTCCCSPSGGRSLPR